MKQKSWIKKYGIHISICVLIAGMAFGFNRKINIDRSHIYAVSEGVTTLLKDVDLKAEETGKLTFTGWGFDTSYYDESSTCELILQDTETGEALWPKMEKKPESVEIADRYTDGEDYSKAGFEGSIKEAKLKGDSVYEILLRYTSSYTDEAGVEQEYVRTVTMDEFLYQGELTEYNPKTFVAPEIAGTELEKELEGTKLFHYFLEGMWVYYDETRLYYVIENSLIEGKTGAFCPVHWYVRNLQNLPEERRQYGYGNNDFYPDLEAVDYQKIEKYKVAVIDLPSEYIMHIDTGLYYPETGWVFEKRKQIGY